MILAKQDGSPNKVILATPDGSGVNQLLFASPELAGQQIQVLHKEFADFKKEKRGWETISNTCSVQKINMW